MDIYLLLSALAALSWALCVILEKHYLLPYFKPQELLILRSSPYLIIFIIYLYSNKKLYNKVVNIDTKTAVLTLLSAILSFLGLYLFWYVLHNNKAAYAVSCVHPLFISFAILLSYFFYKEKINRYESLGILLVLLGIIVINYNKKHSK